MNRWKNIPHPHGRWENIISSRLWKSKRYHFVFLSSPLPFSPSCFGAIPCISMVSNITSIPVTTIISVPISTVLSLIPILFHKNTSHPSNCRWAGGSSGISHPMCRKGGPVRRLFNNPKESWGIGIKPAVAGNGEKKLDLRCFLKSVFIIWGLTRHMGRIVTMDGIHVSS